MEGLVGGAEHGICRLVAAGDAGFDGEPVRARRSEGDPRSSGTRAGSAPRGIGSIEQGRDVWGQLKQLQLLRRCCHCKGHAAGKLLGRHGRELSGVAL